MDYSLVIVTFNQKDFLKRAIESVLNQTLMPKEFIIVDNNSTDGTSELLLNYKKLYPNFRIFKSKSNLGTCKGINLGVHLAKYSIILNMDHDSALSSENWVELAIKKLKKKRIALVWGTSNKGNAPKFKYSCFIGSAILFKKEIYEQLGGFPEDFFIYDNELDLTVRFFIAGVYPYFYEKIDVKHGLPENEWLVSGKKGKLYTYYDVGNRLFIYWKYYPRIFALFLSILHIIKVFRIYTTHFKIYFEPFRALKRFLTNYNISVNLNKKRLNYSQFFKICYQQQYPLPIYLVLRRIYG